jgi:orotate phosphoribosyltransferase
MHSLYSHGYITASQDKTSHYRVLENLDTFLRELLLENEADGIAVRGTSGLSVAYGLRTLAMLRSTPVLPFFMVRKESAHHGGDIESLAFGILDVTRYLIVDDFVSSGHTVASIINKLPSAKAVGLVVYEGMANVAWKRTEAGVKTICLGNGKVDKLPYYK